MEEMFSESSRSVHQQKKTVNWLLYTVNWIVNIEDKGKTCSSVIHTNKQIIVTNGGDQNTLKYTVCF